MDGSLVDYFDFYIGLGLKPIPLYSRSKIPINKQWDQWDLYTSRQILKENPNYNIGILLGDIIDIEGDNDHANRVIDSMIGDYPHPIYKSEKSYHHLFLNTDKSISRLCHNKIEFRAHKHQSVMPPSIINVQYSWVSLPEFIPPIPNRLLLFAKKITNKIKPGHISIICPGCKKTIYLHRRRYQKDSYNQIWKCKKCKIKQNLLENLN